MHPNRNIQIAALIADETPITILIEYLVFADVFLEKSAMVLPEHTEINTHAIDLEEKTLNTYIETNLANDYIWPWKSPAATPILFDKKPNGSLWLYIYYQGLNNITIKNWYLLLLITKSLNCLSRAKRFIQLDLTSAYYRMRGRRQMEDSLSNSIQSF